MEKLGKSIERYTNGGAKFAFWMSIVLIVFIIGFAIFISTSDSKALKRAEPAFLILPLVVFIGLAIYMFFKAKTEIDIREHGLYVRNINESHYILYDEIAEYDKTRRVGKSGSTVIIFYLLVIIKKDGKRITVPFRLGENFIEKLIETSQSVKA